MSEISDPRTERSGARRCALITGASAGIGECFARQLARDQYDLVLVARRRDRLESLAKTLREEQRIAVEVLDADLSEREGLAKVEARCSTERGLDLLVNNAGFGSGGRFAELNIDREEQEVRLNVIALQRLTRAALPSMIRRGRGAIINTSSIAGMNPGPNMATYCATKAFVNSFTEALYEELKGTGVKIQALCPGFTRTEFQSVGHVEGQGVPDFAWMEADQVVAESLAALAKGKLYCIPGRSNRALVAVTSLIPSSITRKVAGSLVKPAGE